MLHGMTISTALVLAAADLGVQRAGVSEWASSAWSIFLLLCGFSLVIFVHELGHFLAAKWAGVRVDRFAIGFGKEVVGFTRGGTRYSLNALPLGGYVKMLGQEDFVVDKSGELKVKDNPDSFSNKSVGRRMVIISAGVIMNLLFAAIAFAIVVMVGRLQPPAVVGGVVPNSPAAGAGLQTGDRIVAINGSRIESFGDLMNNVVLSDSDEPLVLDVFRENKLVEPKPVVLPEYKKDARVRQIGISAGQNLRVFSASIRAKQEPLSDELHPKDELWQLVVDGQAKEFKDLGAFCRAIVRARGNPVDFIVKRPKDPVALTDEQALTPQPDLASVPVRVHCRALWVPAPYDVGETVGGSLLGLVPRLTVAYPPDAGKTFEKAGVAQGDVITKLGLKEYPSYEEIRKLIEESPGREIPIEVRRTREANNDLDAHTVEFCVLHREALIAAARQDLGKAIQKLEEMASAAGVAQAELGKLRAQLEKQTDAKAWRKWLENVDVHKLGSIIPKAPFALFTKTIPTVDATLACIGEDHIVVADVQDKLGEAESPAKLAGIPRGAVILAVDDTPVTRWSELSEAFRAKAGRTVKVTFRVVDQVDTVPMAIPNCITAALDLSPGDRIVKIDGEVSCPFKGEDGKDRELLLPDWRVIGGLLRKAVGKTVQVEYVTVDEERRTGRYLVTANGTDPWLQRVRYSEEFTCYPLFERHPVRNPLLAVGIGFKQAYQATMQTIQTIRHLIITRQVGFSKVSGPVGILRIGSQAADSGVITLLWFLAVLSANLAVINFLPMPIVDGGLFLFLLLEKIRGEPVSIKTQVATQIVGIALIATLFILVTYQDIRNWILGT
jgi:membrane-associated protease RseP (regulator of RpoE activity)